MGKYLDNANLNKSYVEKNLLGINHDDLIKIDLERIETKIIVFSAALESKINLLRDLITEKYVYKPWWKRMF